MKKLPAVALLSFLCAAILSATENGTTPGELTTPYPTITCLAVEWTIDGDDNLDAAVEVEYRMTGSENWRKGMPLVRIPAGNTDNRTTPTYRWDNKFSGSIFDLKPGTEYEIRLSLSDPDGGNDVRTVKASTRPVPREAADVTIKEVNPRTFREAALTASPGDVLLLSPGYYGSFSMQQDGLPGRPIVIRSDQSHPVINSTFDDISLEHRRHVILDGLTINGPVQLRWAENVAVRYCKVNSKFGIIAQSQPGCKNCYIADNEVHFVMPWVNESVGSGSVWGGAANVGEGIEITGPGNVICHNRVSGYRDCISTMEDLWVYDQICIDIYNNDISLGPDDGIEADFCMNNCRIMRNRITNCGMGLSSQPGLGGPIYFIRNVMYNLAMAPFKLERLSYGNLFLHNTVVKAGNGLFEHHGQGEFFRTVFLNNLCIGGSGGGQKGRYSGGDGLAVALPGFNSTCRFDYNGVGTWRAPFGGLVANHRLTSIEELREVTGGSHSLKVDLDAFAAKVDFPDPVFPERQPADLRLARGSAAVDAG
ncbi:MAG TPA: right-handed parallel beta-helix repeat-containing protein, partial [Candidatus Glassbacteria bacterium]|nr:right-handed parallel beta-helix repeat-containing protein [Candidatus Glassbacteria bacterium]